MNILLLEPFFTASHKQWAEELQKHSRHHIELLTMPGRHWKWRIHGAALHFTEVIKSGQYKKPDLLLATDMLDVSTFKSLLPNNWMEIPIVTYFHENQLAYPWSETDKDVNLQRDVHYGWMNYTTALASDKIVFNSEYNKNSFFSELEILLHRFPDFQELQLLKKVKQKSSVIPLGLEIPENIHVQHKTSEPVFVWNHRWEFDKNPDAFFSILFKLKEAGETFKIIVLGESYRNTPPVFEEARKKLHAEIIHWGFCASRSEYFNLLSKANIALVTSKQEFFGLSVAEAIYSGCVPVLPNRLSYPELIPKTLHTKLLYDAEHLVLEILKDWKNLLNDSEIKKSLKAHIQGFEWEKQAPVYDNFFDSLK